MRAVKSSAAYFEPASGRAHPAKPLDAAIPILNGPPKTPLRVIVKLEFESDRGGSFLRKSMVYNGQIHGADAVILTRRELLLRADTAPSGLGSDVSPLEKW